MLANFNALVKKMLISSANLFNCLDGLVGKQVNPSEQEAIDHLMMIAISHYPWSIGKTYQLSQSKVRAEEVIVFYRCINCNCNI